MLKRIIVAAALAAGSTTMPSGTLVLVQTAQAADKGSGYDKDKGVKSGTGASGAKTSGDGRTFEPRGKSDAAGKNGVR